jgi:hypothetical protein
MLIKDSSKIWFLCKTCGTAVRPSTGTCKCGALKYEADKEGRVMIVEDDDNLVIDNDR